MNNKSYDRITERIVSLLTQGTVPCGTNRGCSSICSASSPSGNERKSPSA
jgi:hypothetical protein